MKVFFHLKLVVSQSTSHVDGEGTSGEWDDNTLQRQTKCSIPKSLKIHMKVEKSCQNYRERQLTGICTFVEYNFQFWKSKTKF